MTDNTLPCWDLSPIFSAPDGADFRNCLDSLDSLGEKIFSLIRDKASIKDILPYYNKLSASYETLSAYASAALCADTASALCLKAVTDVESKDSLMTEAENRFLVYLKDNRAQLDDPALEEYRYVLDHMIDDARHKMSLEEEILASDLARTGSNAFERLFDTMTSSTLLDGRTLTDYRSDSASADRKVRESSYRKEKELLRSIQEPVAAALNAIKGTCLTLEERQGWASPVSHSCFISRISEETLQALIGALEKALPMFRSYFRTKARLLKLDRLAWYDISAPVDLGQKPREYSFKEAEEIISGCFDSFCPEMGAFARHAFEHRWIDALPRQGKVGGAFDTAFPLAGESRILSSFTNDWSSVTTLAHELGHAWHDSIVMKEPGLLSVYPMTLAETASIFSEQLLFRHVVSSLPEAEAAGCIEGFLADAAQVCVDILSRYYFEQSVFNERTQGEIPAQRLSQLMLSAQERTYGDAVIDKHELMWAVKGHYYSTSFSFYNYPYAFGQLFALSLFAKGENDPDFADKYNRLLAMTGRCDCQSVAASAGCDITKEEFWLEGIDLIARWAGRLEDFASEM